MRFVFVMSRTAKGLFSNKAMASSIVLVSFVSLLFSGAAMLFQQQIVNLKDQWYDKVEVSAFMCPRNSESANCAAGEATQEQVDAVAAFLASDEMKPYVKSVAFETKAQALESYRRQMAGTSWVEALTEEQMQVSFRIRLVNPEQYEIVSDALSGRPGVEVVNDQRTQLEPLFGLLNKLTAISAALAGVMVVTALLLMPTTIRLSAMSRKEETEIMRYVGASSFFVGLPFVLEGMLSVFLGALFAVAGLWAIVRHFVQSWFASSMQWMDIVDVDDVFAIAPVLVGAALLLAALTSWLSLRAYAKA